MAPPPIASLTFSLLIFALSVSAALSKFSPSDNHLVNCGSAVDATVYNRRFVPDSASDSRFLSSGRTVPLSDPNPAQNRAQIYNTARVFETPSKYRFEIGDPGTHVVRFHFCPFVSGDLQLSHARFHVLVNGYVVLSNFSAVNLLVKEFFIWVDSDKVEITFVPVKSGEFGFVNAIEVISSPKDLILDVAELVSVNKTEKFNGLSKQALETVYRINVGGPKVTPFNDSLWRTWIPDDGFFKGSFDFSKTVHFTGRINYQDGGASREVGPDFVYKTARVITSTNASIPKANLTWEFSVDLGYKYLVRLHFCDIASISLGWIDFNVYVNGYLAYENLDLSYITYRLASPFYSDFVVDGGTSGVLSVSVGPSNMSMAYAVDALLNGVEIMKMNNSMGSLDGKICAGMVLKSWPRGHIGVLFTLIAAVCLLLSVSMFIRRRTGGLRNPLAWTKLPTDVSEVDLKLGN